MSHQVTAHTKSIAGLRIYQASRQLEDTTYELTKRLPQDEFYELGNDLRRSSAAISHYISECHRRYSYTVKLQALHLARSQASALQQLLGNYQDRGYGDTTELQAKCIGVIKQCWGLIKHVQQRQAEQQARAQAFASDGLVAARS